MAVFLDTTHTNTESVLYAIGPGTVKVGTLHLLARALDDDPDENLVVIDAEAPLAPAIALLSEYRFRRPALGIVLMRSRIDVSVMTKALAAGVREVVQADDLQALAEACRTSRETTAKFLNKPLATESGTGNVISVFSSKGGCGKTTLATNIAIALATRFHRKVCIVDLVLQAGDVGVALHLDNTHSIADAAAMENTLDATGINTLLVKHPSGVDCLLAPADPAMADRVNGHLVSEVLQTLKRTYDHIIIDMPTSFTDTTLPALDMSDTYILITTPDITSLKNLRLAIDTFDALGYPRSTWQIVLNRSNSDVGLAREDVEAALGAKVAFDVPSSAAVSKAGNRGVAIVSDEPDHPVSRAIIDIAAHQRGVGAETQAPSPAPSESALGRLFKRK